MQLACTHPPHTDNQAIIAVAGPLHFMRRLNKLEASDWQELKRRLAQAYNSDPTPRHRLHYALVLSAPHATTTERNKAQDLLSAMLDKEITLSPSVRNLIQLRLAELENRQKWTARHQTLQSKVQQLQRQVKSLEHRYNALKQYQAKILTDLTQAKEKIRQLKLIETSAGPSDGPVGNPP